MKLETRRLFFLTGSPLLAGLLGLLLASCGGGGGQERAGDQDFAGTESDGDSPVDEELEPADFEIETPAVTGGVKGLARDTLGLPLQGVSVSIRGGDGSTVQTGLEGFFTLPNLAPAAAIMLEFRKNGYAPQWKPAAVFAGVQSFMEAALKKRSRPAVFDAAEPIDYFEAFSRITIPAGALVRPDGLPATGSVTLTFTPLLLEQGDLPASPGDFTGRTVTGQERRLELVAAAEVLLEQEGRILTLAAGQKATLELLLPERARLRVGDTLTAWAFDEAQGLWTEAGAAAVGRSQADPGRLSLAFDAARPAVWSGGKLMDTYCYRGRVLDADERAVPGAAVVGRGTSYLGLDSRQTGAEGGFCVEVGFNSQAAIEVSTGESLLRPEAALPVSAPGLGASCTARGEVCGSLEPIRLNSAATCLSGRVTDRAGDGVANAAVSASGVEGASAAAARSGADGRYCLAAPPAAAIRLAAFDPETNLAADLALSAPDTRADCGGGGCGSAPDLVLAASCIAGAVMDSAGHLLPGVRQVFSDGGASGVTEADGRFCLAVPGGRLVAAYSPGALPAAAIPPVFSDGPSCAAREYCAFVRLPRLVSEDLWANSPDWKDTLIGVAVGDGLTLWADGQVGIGTPVSGAATALAEPDGLPATPCGANCPMPAANRGALIGKVGAEGTPFAAGSYHYGKPSQPGTLRLVVNDDNYTDNSGFFSLKIGLEHQPFADGDADAERENEATDKEAAEADAPETDAEEITEGETGDDA